MLAQYPVVVVRVFYPRYILYYTVQICMRPSRGTLWCYTGLRCTLLRTLKAVRGCSNCMHVFRGTFLCYTDLCANLHVHRHASFCMCLSRGTFCATRAPHYATLLRTRILYAGKCTYCLPVQVAVYGLADFNAASCSLLVFA